MGGPDRDHGLDPLLDLDGQTFFVDEDGRYWVKFDVRTCPVSDERPHGIRYSLTLHGPKGERLVGIDNAHPVSGVAGQARKAHQRVDHKHRLENVKPYGYRDAVPLLADFWREVDDVLKGLKT